MQPESDMAGGGPGNMEGPDLRAQARAWVLGRRKHSREVQELHSVGLECVHLPSSTECGLS